jgi:hypothetical protein
MTARRRARQRKDASVQPVSSLDSFCLAYSRSLGRLHWQKPAGSSGSQFASSVYVPKVTSSRKLALNSTAYVRVKGALVEP